MHCAGALANVRGNVRVPDGGGHRLPVQGAATGTVRPDDLGRKLLFFTEKKKVSFLALRNILGISC